MADATDDTRVESLLGQLTQDEKVALASGIDSWHTAPAPSIGLPSIKVSDGPSGARGGSFGAVASSSFPCGSAIGATWNPSLVHRVGIALGREAKWKGARVLLAPTINIQRHPFGGRHFECYSEDPFLTSRIAVAYIRGVQGQGVAATAKHFVCNDSEYQRHTVSSEVNERALREIYLPPFEAAILEAGVWALMSAYNRINGTYAAEHELLTDLVKGEWGFDGLIMSDWWGTMSTVASARAGLDLEMPGPPVHFGSKLAQAVDDGEVSQATLDDKSRRFIRLAQRVNAFDDPAPDIEQAVDDPEHRALLRQVAADAAVLLSNDGILPLAAADTRSLAVIGPLADRLTMQGGGSAYVEPHRSASLLQEIRLRYQGDVRYEPGCRIFLEPPPLNTNMAVTHEGATHEAATVEYFASPDLEGEPVETQLRRRLHLVWLGDPFPGSVEGQFSVRIRATYTPTESGAHTFTVASAGPARLLLGADCVVDNWTNWTRGWTFYGAGSDVVEGTVSLQAGQPYEMLLEYQATATPGVRGVTVVCQSPTVVDLLERAVAAAAAADSVVLVVGTTAETEKEGGDRSSLALVGDQDELVRRVAAVNPRTVVVVNAGSPVAMPWSDDVAAVLWTWFPGQQGDEGIADVLFGEVDPGGRLPVSLPYRVEDCPAHLSYPGEEGTVDYADGVFVGYRGYARRLVPPHFPFGYGLSYATFALHSMQLESEQFEAGTPLRLSVTLTNSGSRAGSQVVQVYVREVNPTLLRPDLELKGFAKVHLGAGEHTDVEIALPPRAFAAWHTIPGAWIIEPGEFEILIGTSSADIAERRTIVLQGGEPFRLS
jgi:beta-glucosidase